MKVRLVDIAHARSGDKGDTANVGVIALRAEWYPLIAESLRVLRDRGMTSAALGVDADNPSGALGLYEGLGFAVDLRATAWRRSFE